MDIRLSNRELTGPADTNGPVRHRRAIHVGRWTLIWLVSILFITALIGWLLYSRHREPDAASISPPAASPAVHTANETTIGQASPAREARAAHVASRLDATVAKTGPADALAAIPPVEGLTLVRPSLRRGGLGSLALMTFAIRNRNDYPVKNIRLACTFSSRDGSYTTERHRLIQGVVKANSRKVFRHLLMGFVSVGASRAKCAVLSADWA